MLIFWPLRMRLNSWFFLDSIRDVREGGGEGSEWSWWREWFWFDFEVCRESFNHLLHSLLWLGLW